MIEEKYLALIHKQLSEGLNTSDQAELNKWLAEDKVNQQTLEEYRAIWKLTEKVDNDVDVNVDEAFTKFQNRIQSEQAINSSKTIISPKPNIVPLRRRILQVAAALTLLLGAGFVFNLYNSNKVDTKWVIVTTTDNEKQTVTLNDGTIVSVNQNSTFKYPETFNGKTRNVQLVGEAFFEVKRDESKSFIINTDKTIVTVLGTSFNVREYAKEMMTEVVVKTGKVKFSNKNNKEAVQLTAFKKGVYFHEANQLKASKLSHLNDIAWHSGEVKFERNALKDVLDILNRQLGISIEVENRELLSCNYTGNFTNLKGDQIANAISISFGAANPIYDTTEKHYLISSGSCSMQ